MAARKLQDLQVVVESNADWTGTVLAKPALSVVDVWPEWAGPCLAMRSQLIRFKLKEAGDDLHLFSANASAIDCLSRFRDYSEPTWMFLGSGELVNVYVGCNKPRLLKLVRTELRKEQRVLKGLARRKVLPADKMSPAECERAAAQAARDLQARQEERDRADAALREVRLRQYRRIADQLNNYTVVLYLPHALEQGHLPSVAEALEDTWRAMGIHVAVAVRVCVAEEAADEIFWERRLPQHAALVESLRANGGTCIAQLLRKGRPPAQPEYSPIAEDLDDEDESEDIGGQGDAPMMPRGRRQYADDEEEDDVEVPMRPGLLERLVAETVYGFYPGSAASTPASVTRNDSLSEFFSPVGGSGLGSGTGGASPLQTSPMQSSTTMGQYRRSTASWVRKSVMNMRDQPPVIREQDEDGEGQDEWDDHDLAEYEGCSPSYGSHFEQTWPKELRPVVDSAAAALLHRSSDTSLVLPGLWVPQTPLSKAAAVRVLFPAFALRFYEPEEPPAPPPAATVMCFRANKRGQVLEAAANFLDDIVHLGFFTDEKKLLAEAPGEYDMLRVKEFRDRLVLAMATWRSDEPVLELAGFGPTYMSPTAKQARLDVAEYFGANVERAAPRVRGGAGSEGEGEDEEDEEEDGSMPAPDPQPAQQGLLMLARTQARNTGPPARPPEPPRGQQGAPSGAASRGPASGRVTPSPAPVAREGPAPEASRSRASLATAGPRGSGAGEGRRRDSPSASASRSRTSLGAVSRGSRGSRGSRTSRTRSAAGTPPRLSGESTRRASATSSRGQLSPVPELAVDAPPSRTPSRTPSAVPVRKSKSVLSIVASPSATSATFIKVSEQLQPLVQQPSSEVLHVDGDVSGAASAASSVTLKAASQHSVVQTKAIAILAEPGSDEDRCESAESRGRAPVPAPAAAASGPTIRSADPSDDSLAMLVSLGKK